MECPLGPRQARVTTFCHAIKQTHVIKKRFRYQTFISGPPNIKQITIITSKMTTPEQHPIVRGALIVLEGLDRSGKTTQVNLLEKKFLEQGKKVKVMRFPGTSPSPLLHNPTST